MGPDFSSGRNQRGAEPGRIVQPPGGAPQHVEPNAGARAAVVETSVAQTSQLRDELRATGERRVEALHYVLEHPEVAESVLTPLERSLRSVNGDRDLTLEIGVIARAIEHDSSRVREELMHHLDFILYNGGWKPGPIAVEKSNAQQAANALVQLGEAGTRTVLEALNSPHHFTTLAVSNVLLGFGLRAERAVPDLIPKLETDTIEEALGVLELRGVTEVERSFEINFEARQQVAADSFYAVLRVLRQVSQLEGNIDTAAPALERLLRFDLGASLAEELAPFRAQIVETVRCLSPQMQDDLLDSLERTQARPSSKFVDQGVRAAFRHFTPAGRLERHATRSALALLRERL